LKENGTEINKLEIRTVKGSERGFISTDDIKQGEETLFVPIS
jgi:hypothetical protein